MQAQQLRLVLCLALALCVGPVQPTVAEEATTDSEAEPLPAPEDESAPSPAEETSAAPPTQESAPAPTEEIPPAPEQEPDRLPVEASVARVFSGGRVGAGRCP